MQYLCSINVNSIQVFKKWDLKIEDFWVARGFQRFGNPVVYPSSGMEIEYQSVNLFQFIHTLWTQIWNLMQDHVQFLYMMPESLFWILIRFSPERFGNSWIPQTRVDSNATGTKG